MQLRIKELRKRQRRRRKRSKGNAETPQKCHPLSHRQQRLAQRRARNRQAQERSAARRSAALRRQGLTAELATSRPSPKVPEPKRFGAGDLTGLRLGDKPLNARIIRALQSGGIHTVAQLQQQSVSSLLEISGIGVASLAQLRDALRQCGQVPMF